MSSIFLNGLNTNGISSLSSENNLLLGGTNTNNIQLLNSIIGNGDNNITLNNDTTIKGNTTIEGNLIMNGTVTNSLPVTLTNQLTSKSYVDSIVSTGTIIMYASLNNPPTGGSGYYLCDGSVKNTTTDAALFAVIGYTYGGISPSPNFNLPNLLARFPVGPTTSSSMTYLNNLTGGVTSGNVTLNETNLPPHIHTSSTNHPIPVTLNTTGANNSRRRFANSDPGAVPEFYGNGNADGLQGTRKEAPVFTINSNTITTIENNNGSLTTPFSSTPFSITPPYTVLAYYIKR